MSVQSSNVIENAIKAGKPYPKSLEELAKLMHKDYVENHPYPIKGYIEDLRKHYACPTRYKLIYSSSNMKVFEVEKYGHTVCYGYDVTHNDWYEFCECTFMVHHVEF